MSNRSSIYASELLKRQRELEEIRAELRICGRSELARFQQREAHLVALIDRLKADVAELSRMTHPGFLTVIEDLERQLAAPMPAAVRRTKERHRKIELDRARRAGISADAILAAQRRGRSLK